MLIEVVLGFWGCMPELVPTCPKETFDMTNNSSDWCRYKLVDLQ